ncbi:MAG: ATP-binding cassette domain-containing protein [Peptococcaceae bacterium]|nr:ATP-binding cassette domain-containing protein [Peptococcaceae bacterium]
MQEGKDLIQIKDLHKVFKIKGRDVIALEGINLTVKEGEIFGIIGLSGAGKSTLVRCINFLEKPTSGAVVFDGQDLNTLSDKELRKARQQMGMIFQQFNLLMQRTALENVCFPLELAGVKKDEAVKRAQELLEIVGLSERANAYPVQLSGGQKQRVAIARALATNPKVLLCDEATSALDPQTTASILALLKKLSKEMGITVIIITHEMSVIEEVCSRVAIIANHRIAEVGSVQEIFTHPKTDATRQLVYREEEDPVTYRPGEGRFLRVVYNGSNALEPIIAKMILDLKIPVNIIHANLRTIEGDTYGDMVIQLPDLVESERAMRYLLDRGISVEGVTQDA